jgi:hypothetical protein
MGIKANAAFEIKYHSEQSRKTSTRRRCLAEQLMETFVREEPDDEEDDDDGYSDDHRVAALVWSIQRGTTEILR